MSEDEIIKELADRANKLGVKIDVNIGELARATKQLNSFLDGD